MKSLSLSKPHMITVVGLPGSGKTFFAEKFADTFHAPYISHEKILKLTDNNSKATDELFDYQLEQLLKTKQSIIIEGRAETRNQRLELARKAREAEYEVLLIWVQTDPATAKARAVKESKNKSTTSYSPEEYERQVKHFNAPVAIEKPVVISGKHTYASQAKVILKKLSTPRAEISSHAAAPIRSDQPTRRNITIR
ncbi:MAG TPA: ATP-binding protein [Candidatus Saccharimonadales bacterium]|nr:ATP-binding protein [Candidatus Saccharimonadales bacterium]